MCRRPVVIGSSYNHSDEQDLQYNILVEDHGFPVWYSRVFYVALWNVRVFSEYPDEARDLQQPPAGDNLLKVETPDDLEAVGRGFDQSDRSSLQHRHAKPRLRGDPEQLLSMTEQLGLIGGDGEGRDVVQRRG